MRTAVIGTGNWGTALGILAARAGHDVQLWSRDAELVDLINTTRENTRYLPGAQIPDNAVATNDIERAVSDAELVVLAVPSNGTRQVVRIFSGNLRDDAIVVSATKGIEIESGKRISQIVMDEVAKPVRFVCLSGPSFAKEVVANHPTAVVAASDDENAAGTVQREFSFENFRVYTNNDVVGTELSGSVKNVMAIAAGMTSGLGYGSNSLAALITRGLAEMSRLVISEGGKLETLMGLAGLGDLVLTCTGNLSRNRFVGEQLGKGRTLDEITSGMNEVAEGIKTTGAVKQLAARLGIEMPITAQVFAVLYERKLAREAVGELMSRPLRAETV